MNSSIRAYSTYEASAVIAALAAGAVGAQLKPQPALAPPGITSLKIGLVRLEVSLTTAVASLLGLVRPGSIGTATTSATGSRVGTVNGGFQVASNNGSILSSAWSVAPTVSTPVYRRAQLPATIGATLVWEWPEEDPFNNGDDMTRDIFQRNGILLQNLGAGASAAMVVNYRWIEYNGTQ